MTKEEYVIMAAAVKGDRSSFNKDDVEFFEKSVYNMKAKSCNTESIRYVESQIKEMKASLEKV